jgi:hypothetical protein
MNAVGWPLRFAECLRSGAEPLRWNGAGAAVGFAIPCGS